VMKLFEKSFITTLPEFGNQMRRLPPKCH
jgi:hypothetical protein